MSLFVINLLVLHQFSQVVPLSIVKKSTMKLLVTGGVALDDRSFSLADKNNFYFRLTGNQHQSGNPSLAKHVVSLRTIHYLKYFGDNHFCGGSIISPNKVLTAAHCVHNNITKKVKNPNEIKICYGSPHRLQSESSKLVGVNQVIIHPEYCTYTLLNDIAVLRLSRPIENGITVQSVPIPTKEPNDLTLCTTAGWGRIIDNGPFAADLTYADDLIILPKTLCKLIFKPFNGRLLCVGDYNIFDDESLEKGPCKGDSGGPLICNGTLYGVVSFGLCNGSGIPFGYTNVWYYRDWILNRGETKYSLNWFRCLLITALVISQYIRHIIHITLV